MSCAPPQPAPVHLAAQGWGGALGLQLRASGAVCTRPGAGSWGPAPSEPGDAPQGSGRCSDYLRCFLRSRARGARSAGGETEAGRAPGALPHASVPFSASPPPREGGFSRAAARPPGLGSCQGREEQTWERAPSPVGSSCYTGSPLTGLGAPARLKGGTARAGAASARAAAGPGPGTNGAGAGAVALPLGHGVGRGSPSASVSLRSANGDCGNSAQGRALRPDWPLPSGALDSAN